MHLLIAFIGAIVSLLYALEHFGVDIGWINPWAWKRKRKWLKQYHANPAFSLENPMEAVALLLTATAKIDGDLSLEEKDELRKIFEEEFHQSAKEASALLGSSVYLLGSDREVFNRPGDVLAPSLEKFNQSQRQSTVELLQRIAAVGGQPSSVQTDYIASIRQLLFPQDATGWGSEPPQRPS